MDYETFREKVMDLPVFDTHTHMNMPNVPVCAQSVWDVMHYFWFQRELIAAGYPDKAMGLDEDARLDELAKALDRNRNTSWSRAVRVMVRDLYDLQIDGVSSLRTLDEAIRASGKRSDWAETVARKINVKRITVNNEQHADMPGLPGVGCTLPHGPSHGLARRYQELTESSTFVADLERHASEIRDEIKDLSNRGLGGVRIDNSPYDVLGERVYEYYGRVPADASDDDHLKTYLFDTLFDALNEYEMHAQMFLGMRRGKSSIPIDTSLNDPERIVRLHKLFHRRPGVRFELFMGCEINNMDVVQAARLYKNVYPGGLWWFNFRVSSYLQAMQYRFEALPASRTMIIGTDARCIEWCYTKTYMVKDVMTQFFWDQIQKGWTNPEDALWAARWWLHDTAAECYLRADS